MQAPVDPRSAHADTFLYAAPIRATTVKRAYGSNPGDYVLLPPGLTILLDLPRSCGVFPPHGPMALL